MAITATTGASQATTGYAGVWTDVYILRKFVEMLTSNKFFATFAEPAMIPKNMGGYIARWNVPQAFAGTTTVRPEASAGTVGEKTSTGINLVEATVQTYYDWMKLGEIAQLSWVPGTADVFAEQFADAGMDVIDNLLYAQAKTATNDLTSGDRSPDVGTTPTAATVATLNDFTAISGFFYNQNAKGFKHIGGDYVWLMHPNQEIDLTTETTSEASSWQTAFTQTPVSMVGGKSIIDTHRFVGRFASVTALRTTQIDSVVEGVTTYHSIALARWGLGWSGLAETGPNKPEIIKKSPGPTDTSQPMNMYDTLGWKVKMAAKLLDNKRALIVYSGSSALN